MEIIKNHVKIFMRSPHIIVVALLSIAGLITYLSYKSYSFTMNWDVMYYLKYSQDICLYVFIINVYLSYEYIYKANKNGIEECAASHKNGKLKLYGSCFGVLALLPLLVFAIMAAFNFAIALAADTTDLTYYMHIALINLLNIFLLGILTNLIGMCLALRFKRIAAYSFMALIIFIISPVSDMIPGIATDSYHVNLWPIKRLFSLILPPNQTWVTDAQYGISNEALRWNLTLFWICLFLAVVFFAITKKKKRIAVTALAVILACVNLFGYLQGGSQIILGPYPDSISRIDKEYYREHKQQEKPAAFTVASYNMDIDIHRELKAAVEMNIQNPQALKEYDFTLYRGYKLSGVTDKDGNALDYTRDGDYITVRSIAAVGSIVMRYQGYSPSLFSNHQAVLLPGCFPYYPITGFHQINGGGQGYLPMTNGFRSQYTVRVNSSAKIYSNLPSESRRNNVYSGQSDTVSLIGGFLQEYSVGEYDVCALSVPGYGIASVNDAYISELEKEIIKAEKKQNSKTHFELKNKKIFQVDTMFANFAELGLTTAFDDHVFIMAGYDGWIPDIAETLVKENIDKTNKKQSSKAFLSDAI